MKNNQAFSPAGIINRPNKWLKVEYLSTHIDIGYITVTSNILQI